ncbi:MAG: phospholipase, partial [Candidatus Obscuribacterales bacterium]|nr:phospholipase [Steroidobacteraceae bacterium]
MNIVFVHGWSVTHTDTYGDLPKWLSQQPAKYKIQNVYLGKYISFVDTVTADDIARAFDLALRDALGAKLTDGFACITHSTGGPVVRLWMKLFYAADLGRCPLKHLIMLAPANHGSALAQLGKGVLSRLKSLTEGVEPGARVLDFLELGSDQSWKLNEAWLTYDCVTAGAYLFVLTGQSIDRAFYDHLNAYTGEPGSDGVVRVAAANMNYRLLRLHQDGKSLAVSSSTRCPRVALGVLPGLAHSGDKMGII